MAMAAITKRTVDAAKAGGSDHFLWDDELAGFGLKVTPAGGKVYVYQYRIARPGAAERTPAKRYTIGRHGALTPDQARKRAKELAALVHQGIDPRQRELDAIVTRDEAERIAAEKARLDGELAFERIAALWLDHYANEKERRPSSVRLARSVVSNHLKPKLAGKPMPHIARADLQPILDAIPAQRRGIRRAVFAYASVLFGWAAKRGTIATNPLADMAKPEAPKGRDRVLADAELVALWRGTTDLGAPFGPFFRLLILTGQRRGEVAAMQWTELDRASGTWTIPADRAKNSVAHIVPLSPPVVAELDALATVKHGGGEWPEVGFVFSTTGRTPISGMTKAKGALDAQAAARTDGKPLDGWRIHDLRRTVATGLQRLGVRFEVTEAILNHVSGARGGIAGIYQRHDWKDEKRSALDAWARSVEALVEQPEGRNVVRLARARAA